MFLPRSVHKWPGIGIGKVIAYEPHLAIGFKMVADNDNRTFRSIYLLFRLFYYVNAIVNSLPRCNQCSSPVTEIENHGRVKMGKDIDGSWTCNDCLTERDREEKLYTDSLNRDDRNNVHHEHIGAANKSDVSPNTPTADEADL
jgi:hypothetical protein